MHTLQGFVVVIDIKMYVRGYYESPIISDQFYIYTVSWICELLNAFNSSILTTSPRWQSTLFLINQSWWTTCITSQRRAQASPLATLTKDEVFVCVCVCVCVCGCSVRHSTYLLCSRTLRSKDKESMNTYEYIWSRYLFVPARWGGVCCPTYW
jgi:hypothetical protein